MQSEIPLSSANFSAKSHQKAADVWKEDVCDFQAFSQTSLELRFPLGNEGKDGKNPNSQTWPGTPRHPSSRHPRPPDPIFRCPPLRCPPLRVGPPGHWKLQKPPLAKTPFSRFLTGSPPEASGPRSKKYPKQSRNGPRNP